MKAKAFVGKRRFRQRGSLGGGLMATLLFSQRQRGRISSLGRNIVAATLLPEREFRQSGGPCGLIVAAALLRELSCNLGAVMLPRKSVFRLVAATLCSFRVVASTLLRERSFRLVALMLLRKRSFRPFRHDAGKCLVCIGS